MSMFEKFTVQTARPLPVLVLADVSGSMRDDNKIGILNRSLREMANAFAREDDTVGEIQLAVVAFGQDDAWIHVPLTPASEVEVPELEASGRTPMGKAFRLARGLIEDVSVVPRRSYQPTIVLVSDGRPTDDEWEIALEELLASERASRAMRLAVGVGTAFEEEAEEVLKRFVGDQVGGLIQADDVDVIPKFFRWVTMSVTARLTSASPDDIPTLTLDDLDY